MTMKVRLIGLEIRNKGNATSTSNESDEYARNELVDFQHYSNIYMYTLVSNVYC